MKKVILMPLILVFLGLCSCTPKKENTDTRFMFDTVVTLTANCSDEILDGAFSLCQDFEDKLSITNKKSEISVLNQTNGFTEVSLETLEIIEKSLYYSEISGGKYDITVYPLSSMWNFKEEIIPSQKEVEKALKNVDYKAIEITGNKINLNGKQIDLGSIAKGYIADKIKDYFISNGVEDALINLGGNIVVLGEEKNIGIKKPFSENEIIGNIKIKNKSVVTAGIYERYMQKDGGEMYHHILDTATGYSADTDLYSATVISDSSFDADPLSTICILLGKEKGLELIEQTENTEAILVGKDGNIYYTSGVGRKDSEFFIRN